MKFDSFILEAHPGVIETVLVDMDGLVKNQKMRLLNLGSGVGQLAPMPEYIGFDVTNTDIAIEKQDSKNVKVDFNCTDSLPLPEKSFDVGLCQEVIEHVENPWRLLRLVRNMILKMGVYCI